MIYILGSEGFVGSAFVRYCKKNNLEHRGINRETYAQLKGTRCDIFVNANGNSKKFLANQDPVLEFELSTTSVYKSLFDFQFDQYIYLSSSDVYPDCSSPDNTHETALIHENQQSAYGFHKYLSEKIVQKHARNWLIFRLSGMVGENMRKNPIFDIMNNSPLWVSENSEFQFINTDDVAHIVLSLAKTVHKELFNVGGSGTIKIRDVVSALDKSIEIKADAKTIVHNISVEKISRYFPKIDSKLTIQKFLNQYKEEIFHAPL